MVIAAFHGNNTAPLKGILDAGKKELSHYCQRPSSIVDLPLVRVYVGVSVAA
jgi:hypothetical protein